MRPTLLVGVDVTHPPPGDQKSASIASIVANTDFGCCKYMASIKVQKKRREHVVYLSDAMQERLLNYYYGTRQRPEHIIIFRGGVAEGQYQQVRIHFLV